MQRISFKVPAALLPRQVKRRTVGFMRVFVAGERGAAATRSSWPRRAGRRRRAGAGKPTVKLGKGELDVIGLPARSAVAELTLYRVKKLDGDDAAQRLQASGARGAHGRGAQRPPEGAALARTQRVSVTSTSWRPPTARSRARPRDRPRGRGRGRRPPGPRPA